MKSYNPDLGRLNLASEFEFGRLYWNGKNYVEVNHIFDDREFVFFIGKFVE